MNEPEPFSVRAARLRKRMEMLGYEQQDAAAALGWSVDKVNRVVNGRLKRPRDIEEAETAFERWIAQMEAERGLPAGVVLDMNAERAKRGDALNVRIPVYAADARGGAHMDPSQVIETLALADLFGGAGAIGRLIVAEVTGFDMEPRFHPGEKVIAVRGQWPTPGDDCLVETAEGALSARRYKGQSGGRVWLETLTGEADSFDATAVNLHKIRANVRV